MTDGAGRLRDDSLVFETLIDATSTALGINAAFVEKDYWVIEALRASVGFMGASLDAAGASLIFKGRTSLEDESGRAQRCHATIFGRRN